METDGVGLGGISPLWSQNIEKRKQTNKTKQTNPKKVKDKNLI